MSVLVVVIVLVEVLVAVVGRLIVGAVGRTFGCISERLRRSGSVKEDLGALSRVKLNSCA